MNYLNQALNLKKQLDNLRPISATQEAKISQKFRLDLNFHSNNLEGNSLSFGETKMLILHGITASGKPLKDHFEITGHDQALKMIEEVVKSDRNLSENFVRELHSLILHKPYEIDAITPDGKPTKRLIEIGKYKTSQNHVKTKTGEIFYFAEPHETPAKMFDLFEWYKKESTAKDVNPIILAAQFHYKFILIHPFDDGNGRLARILMNFILMSFGFPPVVIKTQDKENYILALRQADGGLIESFIDYIAKTLIHSLELMIKGAKGEEIEDKDDLDKKIELLKAEFKNPQNQPALLKTKKTILSIFDYSINRVAQKFVISCNKFDEFYLKNSFELNLKAGQNPSKILTNEKPDYADLTASITINSARKYVDEKTDQISGWYKFEGLKKAKLIELNFFSAFVFDFSLTKYSLKLANNQKTISKTYDQQLTDEEIDEIIKLETQRHYQKIEQKIKSAS